jgi:D-beta-D-heptose 7-phosphate kinase/D-beta-D-heptose 1-phosphate adenosyltransferase
MITRSEFGISLFDQSRKRSDFPVRSKEVKDVTGAGDTVLAVMSLALANGLDLPIAIQLANIAAGLSIEKIGCAQITLAEIAERFLEYDCHSKIFEESHTYALHQVLDKKKYSLLILEKEEGMTSEVFRTIRGLADLQDQELIIFVKDSSSEDEFIELLASLHEVKTIILEKQALKSLCDTIRPDGVYSLEGKEISEAKGLLTSLFEASIIPPPKQISSS